MDAKLRYFNLMGMSIHSEFYWIIKEVILIQYRQVFFFKNTSVVLFPLSDMGEHSDLRRNARAVANLTRTFQWKKNLKENRFLRFLTNCFLNSGKNFQKIYAEKQQLLLGHTPNDSDSR